MDETHATYVDDEHDDNRNSDNTTDNDIDHVKSSEIKSDSITFSQIKSN